jgi:predicted dehydrogenase
LEGIDAVTIASCNHHHMIQLERAAKARKDAYCEEPLAMDTAFRPIYDAGEHEFRDG